MHSTLPSAPKAASAADVDSLLAFVRGVGLEVREAPLPQLTFLPGLLIEHGALVVDRQRLLYPGDILHEAGHLAVTPADERPLLGGNITENHPEKEGEEMAVHAWCYAACQALDLAPDVVFHEYGYKGAASWLMHSFQQGTYIGLPLLVWMGLTTAADYPQMVRWLRA